MSSSMSGRTTPNRRMGIALMTPPPDFLLPSSPPPPLSPTTSTSTSQPIRPPTPPAKEYQKHRRSSSASRISTATTNTTSSFGSVVPPTLPMRSPLRPMARSISTATSASNGNGVMEPPLSPSNFTSIYDAYSTTPPTSRSPSPSLPPSPQLPPSPSPTSTSASKHVAPLLPQAQPTKRTHALMELLSSERAYASDLAIIRDIFLPLALGHPPPFQALPTPPSSSSTSTRTLSTASSLSAPLPLSASQTLPTANIAGNQSRTSLTPSSSAPFTPSDVRTIFGNITQLAMFAEVFSEKIEETLGSVLPGGTGDEGSIGQLFLDVIPVLEPPFNLYISRHPAALAQYTSLTTSPTPSIQNYLTQSKTLASPLTNAWDLPALLIKPIQRLLKYPLLLSAIIAATESLNPDHPDLELLREARGMMEGCARRVNEGRRRVEVVRAILEGRMGSDGDISNASPSGDDKKDKGRMKSIKLPKLANSASVTALGAGLGLLSTLPALIKAETLGLTLSFAKTPEEHRIVGLARRIKQTTLFIDTFARLSLEFVSVTLRTALVDAPARWTQAFSNVIYLASTPPSEALTAFRDIITIHISAALSNLENTLRSSILPHLSSLLLSTRSPLLLLTHLSTLHASHQTLLHFPLSSSAKSRPPATLLAASQNYVALNGALGGELPEYVALLERGMGAILGEWRRVQAEFFKDVRGRWGELWLALGVGGTAPLPPSFDGVVADDTSAGNGEGDSKRMSHSSADIRANCAEETVRVWWERFEEVERYALGMLSSLEQVAGINATSTAGTASIFSSGSGGMGV
ncbi:Dbl homology domain-containing protein [Sistotremastrum niveocremeum HHB9708]|uniref:Dbl homology domain-containing protein n=2 Tax=Sistotremastraceae TaxID=3402574 RepID=A0A164MX32_9AGAM|nr:Dbl homology domain-containing protein [Sistotremastrum niveocremeum HHB9708]KZT32807.1 Dbl homology domain-containing protein [Sistotremastrum suecicum HHB10207 ss-3]